LLAGSTKPAANSLIGLNHSEQTSLPFRKSQMRLTAGKNYPSWVSRTLNTLPRKISVADKETRRLSDHAALVAKW
jgi:hypothetical protein